MSVERFVAIEGRLTAVETKLDVLSTKVDDLSHQMLVLHEDTIANIRELAPDPGEFSRKFTEADSKVREDIARRLDPLEAFARTRGFDPPPTPPPDKRR